MYYISPACSPYFSAVDGMNLVSLLLVYIGLYIVFTIVEPALQGLALQAAYVRTIVDSARWLNLATN